MKTCPPAQPEIAPFAATPHYESDFIEQPFDLPDSSYAFDDPEDPSDLEDFDFGQDDSDLDVFIPDDEYDPDPDPNDFWNEELPNDG
jgi:hypothetical protein